MLNRKRNSKKKSLHQSAKKKIVRSSSLLKQTLLASNKKLQARIKGVQLAVQQKYKTIQSRFQPKQAKEERVEFQLLSDKPLTADRNEDIKFGHDVIARSIKTIVEKVEPPFTIGLFGKWGTGKSTIINLTSKYLKDADIETVVFDAWKYEADSLRRQFLIKLDEELGLELNYKSELNQSITIPQILDPWNQFKINKFNFLYIPIALLVLVALASVADYFNFISPRFAQFAKDFGIVGSIFTAVISSVIGSVKIMFATIQQNKTDSAEGFEDRFYNEVLPKVVSEKLLIIIDNLDRTQADKAVSLLSDIKTFLSKDADLKYSTKVVFLIACDDGAIKRHLEKCNYDNPDEYLRKFFNASLTIPLFLDVELDHYTEDLIQQTKVKEFINDKLLSWLITYAFRDNPREIKQFINTLVTQYVLTKNMIASGQISGDGKDILGNIPFLAKILIMRQKYLKYYRLIEYRAIRNGKDWADIEEEPAIVRPEAENNEKDFSNSENVEFKNFIDFISDTRHITAPSLSIFIRLRQSQEEREFTQWPTLLLACIDKADDVASYTIKKIDRADLEKVDRLAYDFVIKEKRNTLRSGKLPDKLITFGLTFIKSANSRISGFTSFVGEFVSILQKVESISTRVEDLTPQIYFEYIYPVLSNQNKQLLVSIFVSLLKEDVKAEPDKGLPPSFSQDLFDEIRKHQDYFEDSQKDVMQTIVEKYHTVDYLKLFTEGKPNLRSYLKDDAIEAYTATISKSDLTSDSTIVAGRLSILNRLYD